MTEQTPDTPSRAWMKYDPPEGDSGEVSLPGYLEAIPSIVAPGDVFSIDATFSDELLVEGGRFSAAAEPADASPNAKLTRAQLADRVNAHREESDQVSADLPKGELVALADEVDRMFPDPPSDPDAGTDDTPEG